jgi:hypothetical protein
MIRYIVGFLLVWLLVGVGAYALSRMEKQGKVTTAKLATRVLALSVLVAASLFLVFVI